MKVVPYEDPLGSSMWTHKLADGLQRHEEMRMVQLAVRRIELLCMASIVDNKAYDFSLKLLKRLYTVWSVKDH